MAIFQTAFRKTLAHEGGYFLKVVDGFTSYAGIKRLETPGWMGWNFTDREKKPPEEEVENYYYLDIWCSLWCHLIDDQKIAEQIFDFAVTTCKHTAIATSQQVVGAKIDGKMGPGTLESINLTDEDEFLCPYIMLRMQYYAREFEPKYRLGLLARSLDSYR